MPYKPILVLDFDGVLNSYKSGWQGARNIPDPPVDGALEFLVGALSEFEVHILSSRSHQWGGRRAMKAWIYDHLVRLGLSTGAAEPCCPQWWMDRIAVTAFAEPWDAEVKYAADLVVKAIHWPKHKPPALVTIDDRALTFTGEWPEVASLKAFKPWNKRADRPSK